MKTWAVILNNRVIDIVQSKDSPDYPPDSMGNKPISVECDSTVGIGMGYVDGGFKESLPQIKVNSVPLSEEQQRQINIEANLEYLICLAELGL